MLAETKRALCAALVFAQAFCAQASDVIDIDDVQKRAGTAKAFAAEFDEVVGDVAIVRGSGDYARTLPSGEFNSVPRMTVGANVVATLGDQFDFLLVFSTFEFDTGDATAFYVPIANDVQGIGLPLFDMREAWSSRRLYGYIDMAAFSRYELDGFAPAFDTTLDVALHEIFHRWSYYGRFIDQGGDINTDLLGQADSHWSRYVDSDASLMGGADWRESGSGTWVAADILRTANDIDLYLGGFLDHDVTGSTRYLSGGSEDPDVQFPTVGETTTASATTVTIDAIIAAEGPRVPSAIQAQRTFRAGIVLLALPGEVIPDSLLANLNQFGVSLEQRFAVETRGRGSLSKRILSTHEFNERSDPTISATPDPANGSASISAATAWLLSHQQPDGAWSDTPDTPVRDTAAALAALEAAGVSTVALAQGRQFIASRDLVDRDDQAWASWRSISNFFGDLDRDMEGWGFRAELQNTQLDTALVLRSLDDADVDAPAAVHALFDDLSEGPLSVTANGAPSLLSTTVGLEAAARAGATAPQVAGALDWLLQVQNADGGFGHPTSTSHETALALIAMNFWPAATSVAVPATQLALERRQGSDGSWDSSAYSTAMAVLALRGVDLTNLVLSEVESENTAIAGENLRVRVEIGNDSADPSGAFSVALLAEGTVISSLPSESLEPGGVRELELYFDTTAYVGETPVSVVIDPEMMIAELSESDNRWDTVVEVLDPPALPDLLFDASSLVVNPGVIDALPHMVQIDGAVRNLGQSDAGTVPVIIRKLDGLGNTVILHEFTVDAPASAHQPFSVLVQINEMPVEVELVVDPENVVAEYREENNRVTIPIVVQQTANLVSQDLEIISQLPAGQATSLRWTVLNSGTTRIDGARAEVRVADAANNVTTIFDQTLTLAAGQSAQRMVTFTPALAGVYEIEARIDPQNDWPEVDESDNNSLVEIAIGAGTQANLFVVPGSVSVSPNPALAGAEMDVLLTIQNAGQAAGMSDLAIQFGDALGAHPPAVIERIDGFSPGEIRQIVVSVSSPPAGRQRLFAVADFSEEIPEESETDNIAQVEFDVLRRPDLRVDESSIVLDPSVPLVGEPLSIQFDVSNQGEQPAAAFAVSARATSDSGESRDVFSEVVDGLEALSSEALSFQFVPADGETAVEWQVDPLDAVAESDESNNVAVVDLVIANRDFYLSERFFSPNGDGIQDLVSIGFDRDIRGDYAIHIYSPSGYQVQSWTLDDTDSGLAIWDGRTRFGRVSRDGSHRIELHRDGTRLEQRHLVLDTNRTPVERSNAEDRLLEFDLDCADDASSIDFSEDGRSLFIRDETGVVEVRDRGAREVLWLAQSWFVANGIHSAEILLVGQRLVVRSANTFWLVEAPGAVPRQLQSSGRDVVYRASDYFISRDSQDNAYQVFLNPAVPPVELGVLSGSHVGTVADGELFFDESYFYDTSAELTLLVTDSIPYTVRLPFEAEHSRVAIGSGNRVAILTGASQRYQSGDIPMRVAAYVATDNGFELYYSQDWIVPDVWDGEIAYLAGGDLLIARGYANSLVRIDGTGAVVVEKSIYDPATEIGAILTEYLVVDSEDEDSQYTTPALAIGTPERPDSFGLVADERRLQVALSAFGYSLISPSKSGAKGGSGYRQEVDRTTEFETYFEIDTDSLSSRFVRWTMDDEPGLGYWIVGDEAFGRGYFDLSSSSYRPVATNLEPENLWPNRPGSVRRKGYRPNECVVYESRDNLVAQFSVDVYPALVEMTGTAADANFLAFSLAYRKAGSSGWTQIGTEVDRESFDAFLGDWSPPSPGGYELRLQVRDRAGNRESQIAFVSFLESANITSLVVTPAYLSPDGDGVQDQAVLQYRVIEPFESELTVSDESGQVVWSSYIRHPTVSPDTQSLTWTGRDMAGIVVPDGNYFLRFEGRQFLIVVDTVAPAVSGEFLRPYRQGQAPDGEAIVVSRTEAQITAEDNNLAAFEVTSTLAPGSVLVDGIESAINRPVSLSFEQFVHGRLGVEARDKAGNRTLGIVDRIQEDWVVDQIAGTAYQQEVPYEAVHQPRLDPDSAAYLPRTVPADLMRLYFRSSLYAQDVADVVFELSASGEAPYFEPAYAVPADMYATLGLTASEGQVWFELNLETIPWLDFRIRLRGGDASGPLVSNSLTVVRSELTAAIVNLDSFHADPERRRVQAFFQSMLTTEERRANLAVFAMQEGAAGIASSRLQVINDIGDRYPTLTQFTAVESYSGHSLDGSPVSAQLFLVPADLCDVYRVGNRVEVTLTSGQTRDLLVTPIDPQSLEGGTTVTRRCIQAEAEQLVYFGEQCDSSLDPVLHLQVGVNSAELISSVNVYRVDAVGGETLVFNDVNPDQGFQYTRDIPLARSEAGIEYVVEGVTDSGDVARESIYLVVDNNRAQVSIDEPLDGGHVCAVPGGEGSPVVPILGRASDNFGLMLPPSMRPEMFHKDSVLIQLSNLPSVNASGCQGRTCSQRMESVGARNEAGHLGDMPAGNGSGQYTVLMESFDVSGARQCAVSTFTVDASVDYAITADRGLASPLIIPPMSSQDRYLISPNGDGIQDEIRFDVTPFEALSMDAYVTEVVLKVTQTSTRYVPSGDPLTSLHLSGSSDAVRQVAWDGSGVSADGLYAVVIDMEDACGLNERAFYVVERDTLPPDISIDFPQMGDPLAISTPVQGLVADRNFLVADLVVIDDAGQESLLNTFYDDESGILATWNLAAFAQGTYRLQLRAQDEAGNAAVFETVVDYVDLTQLLWNAELRTPAFSPNADGILDRAEVLLGIETGGARISAHVEDDSGQFVVQLLTNVQVDAGVQQVFWDGETNAGSVAQDAQYTILLDIAAVGSSLVETVQFSVTLDTTPPDLILVNPRGALARNEGGVVIEAYDTTFSHVEAWHISSNGSHKVLDSRAPGSHVLVDLAGLSGIQEIEASAADLAGNVTDSTWEFEIDGQPPVVSLESPVAGNAYAPGPIPIQGTGADDHLQSVSVSSTGENGVDQQIVTIDAVSPSTIVDYSWMMDLADGDYVITLTAVDEAGWESSASVDITVDATPPEAVIESPASGALINAPISLIGTAYDRNFQEYRIQLSSSAEGPFSDIFVDTQARQSAQLWALDPLPATDSTIWLRVMAIDTVGLSTVSTPVALEIDRIPPPPVLDLVGERVQPWSFQLNWDSSSAADVDHYLVVRNSGELAEVAQTSYLDADLPDGDYVYTVHAVDAVGNRSDASNSVVFTVDRTPPHVALISPLSNGVLRAEAQVVGTVRADDDLDHYALLIREVATNLTNEIASGINEFEAERLWLLDTLLLPDNTPLQLGLSAVDTTGNEAVVWVDFTVDNLAPAAPTSLTAVLENIDDARLSWDPNTESDIAGYFVYRDGVIASGPESLDGVIAATNWLDADVADGVTSYEVRAIDQAGNVSDPSNPADVQYESGPPDIEITHPMTDLEFDEAIAIRAESGDNDIVDVALEYATSGSGPFIVLNVDDSAPYDGSLDPMVLGLSYGTLYLRARATDQGGLVGVSSTVRVQYRDITPPEAVDNLTAQITGGTVALNWSHPEPGDAHRYQVEARGNDGIWRLVSGSPVSETAIVDSGRADGYVDYRVVALDLENNASAPIQIDDVLVFTPHIDFLQSPTLVGSIPVSGQSPTAGQVDGTVQNHAGTNLLPAVNTQSDGTFTLNVSLADGVNTLSVVAHYGDANTSKAATALVTAGLAPDAPTDLQAIATGFDVALDWSDPLGDVLGYRVFRDGESVLQDIDAQDMTLTASSNGGFLSRVLDDVSYTYWYPSSADLANGEPWVQFAFPEPRLMVQLDMRFSGGDIEKYAVEYWDGAQWQLFSPGTSQTFISNDRAIYAQRWRVRFEEYYPYYPRVRFNELTLLTRPLMATTTAADLLPADGAYEYAVSAVSDLGFEGPRSDPAAVQVGDFEPPASVTLTGAVDGRQVTLQWGSSDATDFDGYQVYRDGNLIAVTDDTTFVDGNLMNGVYTYQVIVFDQSGNQSNPSNTFVANVDIAVPVPYELTASLHPDGGIELDWQADAELVRFRVHRGQLSGDYETIGLSNVREFVDMTARSGIDYFYAVSGIVINGEESALSNEASARIPAGEGLSAPRILAPGIGGTEVTVNASTTIVSGVGPKNAMIDLFRGEELLGTTTVDDGWRILQTQFAGGYVYQPEMSASGSWILVNDRDLVNLYTGEERRLPIFGRKGAFSVDGDVVYIATGSEGYRYRISTGELEHVASHPGLTMMVPNAGQTSAIVVFRDVTNDYHYGVVDLISGIIQPLGISAPSYAAPWMVQWTSNGDRVALWEPLDDGGELWIFEPQVQVQFALGINADRGFRWRPQGDMLAIPVIEDFSYAPMVVWDAVFGGFTELSEATRARWSPDGQLLAALGVSGDIAIRSAATLSTLTEVPLGVSYPAMEWRTDGYLTFLYNGVLAYLTGGGFFEFTDVTVGEGENRFWARAHVADSASQPSDSLFVIRDASALPDLAVTSAFAVPASGTAGAEFELRFTVENVSQTVAGSSFTDIVFTAPDGSSTEQTIEIPPIQPYASQSFSVDLGVANSIGLYRARAVADSGGTIAESSETNNQRTVSIGVTDDTTTPTLSLTLAGTELAADQAADATAQGFNPGADISGNLEIWLENAAGQRLTTLIDGPATVPAGQSDLWSSAVALDGYFAGSYRLHGILSSESGETWSEAVQPFSILQVAELALSLAANPRVAAPGDHIQATAGMEYTRGNAVMRDAAIIWSLRTGGGTTQWQSETLIASIIPGSTGEFPAVVPTDGLPAGFYTLRADLRANGNLQARSEVAIEMRDEGSDGLAISGTLGGPARIPAGSALEIGFQIETSQPGITVPGSIRLLRQTDLSEIAQVEFLAATDAAGVFASQAEFPGVSSPLGQIIVELTETMNGPPGRLLARRTLSVIDLTPPSIQIVTPVANQLTAADVLVRISAYDAHSRVDHVRVRVDNDVWRTISSTQVDGLYQRWVRSNLDGPHTLQAMAIDTYGNQSAPVTASFTADTIAPDIQLTGVADGALVNVPVAVAVSVTDAHPGSLFITLNGESYASGDAIVDDGTYQLLASATDLAGNASSAALNFAIDQTAPVITYTSPQDGAIVDDVVVDVHGQTEPFAVVQQTQPPGVSVQANAQGAFVFAGVPLAEGINEIAAQALDVAGNLGASASIFITSEPLIGELSAQIVASPAEAGLGESITLEVLLTNTGSADLVGTSYEITLVDGGSTTIDSVPGTVSLVVAESASTMVTLETAGSAPGPHAIRVEASDQLLASSSVTLLDTAPPSITLSSPQANSIWGATVDVSGLVSDQHGSVASVEYALDGEAWQPTAAVGGSFADQVVLSHGDHTIQIRAEDQAGNSATSAVVSFTVDIESPTISISGVAANGLYNVPVQPVVGIVDPNLDSSVIELNGIGFISGTAVTQDGDYELFVQATDTIGNTTSRSLTFSIDQIAPAITVEYPVLDSTTTEIQTPLLGHTEAFAAVTLSSDEGSQMVQADAQGEYTFTDLSLAEGLNTWLVSATDAAGNVSDVTQWRVYRVDVDNISGAIVVPQSVAVGASLNAQLTLSNLGSVDVARVEMRGSVSGAGLELVSPVQEYSPLSAGDTASLNLSWPTPDGRVGVAQVALQIRAASLDISDWTTLVVEPVSLVDGTPPVVELLSPNVDAIVGPGFAVTAAAEDSLGDVASVEYRIDAGDWRPMTVQGDVYTAIPEKLAEGDRQLSARGTDSADNASPPQTINIVYDSSAPIISITGVSDGDVTALPVTPMVVVDEVHPGQTTIELNSAAFASGTEISAEGSYELAVHSVDMAGNAAGQSLTFIVDRTPPALAIVSPDDGSVFDSPEVTVVAESESGISVSLEHLGMVTTTTTDDSGQARFPIVLSPGSNLVIATAVDAAGNQALPQTISLTSGSETGVSAQFVDGLTQWSPGSELARTARISNHSGMPIAALEIRLDAVAAGAVVDELIATASVSADAAVDHTFVFATDLWPPAAVRFDLWVRTPQLGDGSWTLVSTDQLALLPNDLLVTIDYPQADLRISTDFTQILGQTRPGATVELAGPNRLHDETTALTDGSYRFFQVPVPPGQHVYTVTATDAGQTAVAQVTILGAPLRIPVLGPVGFLVLLVTMGGVGFRVLRRRENSL